MEFMPASHRPSEILYSCARLVSFFVRWLARVRESTSGTRVLMRLDVTKNAPSALEASHTRPHDPVPFCRATGTPCYDRPSCALLDIPSACDGWQIFAVLKVATAFQDSHWLKSCLISALIHQREARALWPRFCDLCAGRIQGG